MNVLSKCLCKLPLSFFHGLQPLVNFTLYRLLKYRKKVVRQHLKDAFPDKSDAERLLIEKKFFKHLSLIMIEAIKNKGMTIDDLVKRFHITNPELIEQLSLTYGGVILLIPHYANWEWGISLGDQLKTPCISFYKTLHNPKANANLLADRNRFKMQLEPVDQAAKVLLKTKNKNNSYVVLFDQNPVGTKQIAWIKWLNQTTKINLSPTLLAAKLNYPLVYLNHTSIKKGFYEITAEIIEEQPTKANALAITTKYMRKLEQQIQQQPEYWLWSHKRWKDQPAADEVIHE